MANKKYSVVLITYLIGSTLCVIPEGEYQIGPVFGPGSRFLRNKHFEAFFDKGSLKPLLAKKVILGVGAVGAGALAAGGAALLAKKIHHHKNQGPAYGPGPQGPYPQGPIVHYPQGQGGWYPPTNDYAGSPGYGSVNFPATDYQYQGYPSPAAEYNPGGYIDQTGYSGGNYVDQGYGTGGYVDQGYNNYDYGQGNRYSGWSQ